MYLLFENTHMCELWVLVDPWPEIVFCLLFINYESYHGNAGSSSEGLCVQSAFEHDLFNLDNTKFKGLSHVTNLGHFFN